MFTSVSTDNGYNINSCMTSSIENDTTHIQILKLFNIFIEDGFTGLLLGLLLGYYY